MADEWLQQELVQFCTYAVTTKSGQIRSKFWPEPDSQKRAGCRICRSRNPVHPYIFLICLFVKQPR